MRSPAENINFQSTIMSRFDLIFIVKDIQVSLITLASFNHYLLCLAFATRSITLASFNHYLLCLAFGTRSITLARFCLINVTRLCYQTLTFLFFPSFLPLLYLIGHGARLETCAAHHQRAQKGGFASERARRRSDRGRPLEEGRWC
jgi:hypothetical protein